MPPVRSIKPKFAPLSADQIAALGEEDLAEYEEALEEAYWARGKASFLDYCTMVELPGAPVDDNDTSFFPDRVKPVAHHKLLIDAIQKLADGTLAGVDGIMCFMPPGAAKSSYLSVLGASWLIGRKPGTNVIGASYGQDLANRFGRRVRHIARSTAFEKIMGCTITGDNQAVDSWSLSNGSDYRAAGFGAAVTGFRADWALIDDPIKNREDADSEIIRNKIHASYEDDISTRLKPGGKIVFALTRWHQDDPAGRILGEKWKGQSGLWRGTDGRLWYVITLPLLAEHADDPLGRKPGELLWPQWFRTEDATRLQEAAKKGGSAARTWSSLYQQRPAPNEGAILARSYWRAWEKKDAPECSAIYLAYDTAFEEDESNDYSAMTAWGVFDHISRKPGGEEYKHKHVILLGAWQERVSAVDLIDTVQHHAKLFMPDRILVEKRASGIQLIQELQRRRLPVKAWLPRGKPGSKGKVPRAHAIATILEGGSVWYIPGPKTEIVLEQCAAFPFGTHDDSVDTVTCMLAFFRDKYIFQTHEDELDPEELKEELLRRSDANRRPRSLYSGPVARAALDIDESDIERMTPETRRRLYS